MQARALFVRRIALPVMALALLLGMLASQVIVRQLSAEAEAQGRTQLSRSLDQVVWKINSETGASRTMGAAIMLGLNEPMLKAAVNGKLAFDAPEVLTRLQVLRREFSADGLLVIDRHGVIVAEETLQRRSTGSKVAEFPYFVQAMHGQASVHASVGAGGERSLYLAAPLREADTRFGPVIGVVAVKLSGEPLDLVLEELAAEGLLLSPQGVVFAATRPEWRLALSHAMSVDELGEIRRKNQFGTKWNQQAPAILPFDSSAAEVVLDGARYAVESQVLDWNDAAGGWQVVALRDTGEWFSAQRRLKVGAGVTAVGLLLGLLTVLVYRFREKAQANRMALEAEQRMVETLRTSERLLEARVEERTAELSATVIRLQQTQHELVEAEKLASLGALVAGVAHELNTPVGNALITASTLEDASKEFNVVVQEGHLKRSALDSFLHKAMGMSELLVRSCQRAASLISSFKQVAVDQTSEQQRQFDLKELVEDNVASLRPSFKHASFSIEIDVPAGLKCDSYPGPLGQVLVNLVQNAAAHAFDGKEQGRLLISATLAADTVQLVVTDDGKGMAPETLTHIFEPFFTTRLGQGGSGLGLAICRNIVTGVLGGSLHASSQLGAGSRFVLSFPRVAVHQVKAAAGG